MKKITALIIIILVLLTHPAFAERTDKKFRHRQKNERKAFWSQQKSENRDFKRRLNNIPPEERASEIAKHRETQFNENRAFREKLHVENMALLKEKLAKNKKLTDAEKTDLINFTENQYRETLSFRDQQHAEDMAFFERIANDSVMTQEQKKQAIKD